MFVYKNKEGRYLIILVVVMTFVIKEERDYEYLVRCFKAEGIDILIYGIDGECVFECGFESVFLINDGFLG